MGFARALLGLLLASATVAGPALASDADHEFKDWYVACDNVRVCVAYGLQPDEGGAAVLRIRREAEAAATPSVDILVAADDSKGVSGPLTLVVDGKALARTAGPVGAEDDYRTWDVPEASVAALLAAIPRGEAVELKAGERVVATVSLSGASAALRWMDDRQKRVGGVTALVAKGSAPASAVPRAPAAPRVRPAAAVSQDGLTDTPPPAVLQRIKSFDCQAQPPEGPTSSRLARGVILWEIPCWVGAYQISSVLVLADEKGGNVRLADLGGNDAGGDPDGRAMATSADYDPKERRLYSYAKGRGIGDCGVGQTYAWTAKGFVLIDRTELSVCRGLPEELWVETYRSR